MNLAVAGRGGAGADGARSAGAGGLGEPDGRGGVGVDWARGGVAGSDHHASGGAAAANSAGSAGSPGSAGSAGGGGSAGAGPRPDAGAPGMSGSAGGGSVTLSAAIMNLGPVQHCGMGGGELAVHYDAPPGGYIDPNSVHYGRGGCGECHVSFSGPAEKPTRIEVKVVHTFDLGCQSECAYCDWNGKGVEFVAYVP